MGAKRYLDDSAVSALAGDLESSNAGTRRAAANELARHYLHKRRWTDLAALLEHRDASVREGAARELKLAAARRRAELSPVVPALVEALTDERVEVRRDAADALGSASEVEQDVAFWQYHPGLDLTPAIPILARALDDDDPLVRAHAARGLKNAAESGSDVAHAIPALTDAALDVEESVRRYAGEALDFAARSGHDITGTLSCLGNHFRFLWRRDWKFLDESLRSDSPGERRTVARALQLAAWRRVDVSALARALGTALDDPDPHVRWDAARALRYAVENGTAISDAVTGLTRALSDPFSIAIDGSFKHIVRRNASAALATQHLSESEWQLVERLLKDEDEEVERGARIALNKAVRAGIHVPAAFDGYLSTENVVHRHVDAGDAKGVVALLRRDEDWTRIDIARAMARSAHEGSDTAPAVSDFVEWLSADDRVLRINAAETLGDAADEGLDISSAVPGLAQLLSEKDAVVISAACWGLVAHYVQRKEWDEIDRLLTRERDDVREGAVEAVGHVHSEISPVIPVLAGALSDRDNRIRFYAAWALENAATRTGSDMSSALPALKRALTDEDEGVRSIAGAALARLDH